MTQCQKPSGPLGRLVLRLMNVSHSKVTDWGLSHFAIPAHAIVLDVGCGGGRTVSKLAALVPKGKVYGVDHSPQAVATAKKLNSSGVSAGRVEIVEGSVGQLPFSNATFDVVTAVETHFWWPDLPHDMREVSRVMKPGGTLIVIAEVYANSNSRTAQLAEKYSKVSGMKMLSVDEHRQMLEDAGFKDIQIATDAGRGWICCIAQKTTEAP